MKNLAKLFGLIVFMTIIGLSNGYGQAAATWPTDDVWASYGLAGLQQPAGTEITITNDFSYFKVNIISGGKEAYDAICAYIRGIEGATLGGPSVSNSTREATLFRSPTRINVAVTWTKSNNNVEISVQKPW